MKLLELGIISDSDVSNKEDATKMYKLLLSKIDQAYEGSAKEDAMKLLTIALGYFFAKVYVNYNWNEIMTSKEFKSFVLEDYYKAKFDRFIENLVFDLPYLGKDFSSRIYLHYSATVKRLIKLFHHDRIINGVNDFIDDNFTVATGTQLIVDNVSFVGLYNAIVLGSKLHVALGASRGDGDEE